MNLPRPIPGFAFTSPHDALRAMLERVHPVPTERVALRESFGRVLAQPLVADRDSPPHDVSAMDGYAVRASMVVEAGGPLSVAGTIAMGQPPPAMPNDACLRISTGACVPAGCDGVLPREQVEEGMDRITLPPTLTFKPGQHIRRAGENARRGDTVVPAGRPITPPVAGALAAFGLARVAVYRPVRVALLTTGNELLPVETRPQPWQIRDSNHSTLHAGLANLPWIQVTQAAHTRDDRAGLAEALRALASTSDLVVTTGGVSMGDQDYLKPALLDCGGTVYYHKLPIRPGKPGLGGQLPDPALPGRAVQIVALPGNPVAVAVGLSLLVLPVARALAGFEKTVPDRPRVAVLNPPAAPLHLWRYLPARRIDHAAAELLTTRGSGDLANAADADGYVEIPPAAEGAGPWLFYDAAR